MKNLIIFTLAGILPTLVAADSRVLSSAELKVMDCAELHIEHNNAKRSYDKVAKNIAQLESQLKTQATQTSVSKWAGLASSALSSFGSHSEKATKAQQVASTLAGEPSPEVSGDLEYYQTLQEQAQQNLDNIAVYQKTKKCNF